MIRKILWYTILFFIRLSYSMDNIKYIEPCKEDSYYCSGDVLEKVQMSGIFKDSKTFVDMPLKQNWNKTIKDDILNATSKSELTSKINQYFYKAGEKEWRSTNPSDWKDHPKVLDKIQDPNYKKWAKHLCGVWKDLVREVNTDVGENNQRYSMIYLKEPLVVPGGRFREVYYWDTYWSIEGLLHCRMLNTTKGILENLFKMVETYGFIPNGGRKYYENRSQPPFLTLMVLKYWEKTKDSDFIKKHHQTMINEYVFWMRERVVNVNTTSNEEVTLNRYFCKLGYPRPESYKEDVELVNHAVDKADADAQKEMYSHIASAAESGWDFSSRWFEDFMTMKTIKTADIIPVDLNSILCAVEYSLAFITEEVMKDSARAQGFLQQARTRRAAIDDFFWDESMGLWLDYDIKKKSFIKHFYSSSIFPLWIDNFDRSGEVLNNATKRDRVYQALQKNTVLSFPGGLPTSLINSGQQWDFPNVWAPIQHVAVYAFDTTNEKSKSLIKMEKEGETLAKKFVENAYLAWRKNGNMFEKYNAEHPGQEGHGGEYEVQLGFGWTNGVILDFLDRYGDKFTSPPESTSSSNRIWNDNFMLFKVMVLSVLALLFLQNGVQYWF